MGAEEVLNEVVTSSNLETLLRRCADNLPGDYKPDSHSWGGAAASELLHRLRGTALEAEANRIFERFLTSGSADEARLARNYIIERERNADEEVLRRRSDHGTAAARRRA